MMVTKDIRPAEISAGRLHSYVFLIMLMSLSACDFAATATSTGNSGGGGGGGGGFTPATDRTGMVTEVLSGETVRLNTGEVVKYIGLSSPGEGERCSTESKQRNAELTLGKTVGLDVCETSPLDEFGRTLAYVTDGSEFVNEILVSEGWAIHSQTEDCSSQVDEEFSNLEEDAKSEGLGIHGPNCEGDEETGIKSVTVDPQASQFDPPGDDVANLNMEYVVFNFVSSSDSSQARIANTIDMKGWKVTNDLGQVYTFGNFSLSAGGYVRLHTGEGSDTTLDLYWGLEFPVWNNDGDVVTLKDDTGQVIDTYSY